MRLPGRGDAAADHLALDPDTARRLLAGELADDDAPPAYAAVARVLAAAAAPAGPDELEGEAETRAAYVRGVANHAPTLAPRRLAVAVIAALLLGSGVASAATGTLPGRVQDAVSDVLDRVGISVPGGDDAGASPPTDAPASAAGGSDASGLGRLGSGAGSTAGQGREDASVAFRVESVAGEDAVAASRPGGTPAGGPAQDGAAPAVPGDPPAEEAPPPGQGGTPPGHGGTPPGQGSTPIVKASTPPGHGGTPPGQGNGNASDNGGQGLGRSGAGALGGFPTDGSTDTSRPR